MPDSAARRLSKVAGRAETRLQYELHRLFVREFRVAVYESQGHCLLADQLHIDAAAVVGDHDHDLGAVARQADRDSADIRLVQSGTPLCRFDAVNHGVAEHMFQGRDHALEHLPVEFCRCALNHEFGTLARVVEQREIPFDPIRGSGYEVAAGA